jgi:hypothetical protein
MTELEWMTCTAPSAMLDFLGAAITQRSYLHFVVACCRRIWGLLPEEARVAVETAEQHLEGRCNFAEVLRAAEKLSGPARDLNIGYVQPIHSARWPSYAAAAGRAVYVAAISVARGVLSSEDGSEDPAEQAAQCFLIRDVFGNPFHPVAIDSAWLGGQSAVVSMAKSIRDSGSFQDMPILGDALQEAGCQDEAILGHCRDVEHVAGCWLLNAIIEAADAPRLAAERQAAHTDVLLAVGRRTIEQVDQTLQMVEQRRIQRQERIALWVGVVLVILFFVWLLFTAPWR